MIEIEGLESLREELDSQIGEWDCDMLLKSLLILELRKINHHLSHIDYDLREIVCRGVNTR